MYRYPLQVFFSVKLTHISRPISVYTLSLKFIWSPLRYLVLKPVVAAASDELVLVGFVAVSVADRRLSLCISACRGRTTAARDSSAPGAECRSLLPLPRRRRHHRGAWLTLFGRDTSIRSYNTVTTIFDSS